MADLCQNMQNAHETARKTMKTTSRAMKCNYDLHLLERNYKLGDAVYLLDTALLKGLCKKKTGSSLERSRTNCFSAFFRSVKS